MSSIEENTVTVNISLAILPMVLAALCRDDEAKCPLITLHIVPPQRVCPFENINCPDMSMDDWQGFIDRNLSNDRIIEKNVRPL